MQAIANARGEYWADDPYVFTVRAPRRKYATCCMLIWVQLFFLHWLNRIS